LTHPTLSGQWISGSFDATFEGLAASFGPRCGACAVGLPGVGGYNHAEFYLKTLKYPRLVPVAAINSRDECEIENEIDLIHGIGFRAIKVHPRLSGLSLKADDPLLNKIFSSCSQRGLVVFLCTYISAPLNNMPECDPLWTVVTLLKRHYGLKCVLLHGGVSRLLQYADIVRFNPNVLLDLSFTIVKFAGSSLEMDMKYLLENLDRRICVGSDHPEISIEQLESRLELLTDNLSNEKRENIYKNNIMRLLGLNNHEVYQ
jgi:predicted TIM-barrel fold metal-dependent hydrolase